MAMQLETISKWLDDDDTQHRMIEEKDLIVFGAQGDVITQHFIRLKEDGEMFNYQVQILTADDENLSVPSDHKHINVLLKYLLHENYATKFGCWEYDHTDGDIRFSVEIPLEDGVITQKQFERISSLMFRNVDTMSKNILKILETGEFPEEEDSADAILRRLVLQKMMEDGLLGDSKKSSSSKKSDIDDDDDGI